MSEAPTAAQANELNSRFNRLFRDGKLVHVHVHKWSMQARLTEDDLPIEEGKTLPTFVNLGTKWLIDDKEHKKFTSIEGAARNYLRTHSYHFPIAQAHFVPTKTLVPVLEKLEEFRGKFNASVEAFMSNYETLKEQTLQLHEEHRETLTACFPKPERVREKFGFYIGMFEIAFPKQMKEIDLASVRAEDSAKNEMQKKFEAEWQKQYTQSLGQIDSFLKESVASTRGRIVEVFETIARKVKNREVVSATNVKTMSGIIEAFDGLDFLNDNSVRTKLEAVKGLITSGRDFKDDQDAIRMLGTAVDDVLQVARDTSDLDSLTGEYTRRIEL